MRPTTGRKAKARTPTRERVSPPAASVQKVGSRDDEPYLGMPVGKPAKSGSIGTPQEGCYVYGIIAGGPPLSFGKTAIGGVTSHVITVHQDGLAAIASAVKTAILDPTRENALAHEHVVERVMQTHTIIPMSFATIFRSEDDIRQVLKSIAPALRDVLSRMEGKIELGLKVTWHRDKIIERLRHEHEEIRKFNAELAEKKLQSTYFARMQLGRMIDRALEERAAAMVQEIYEGLRPVCQASRDNRPIGDKMILNAVFLLERKNEAEFDRIIQRISEKFGDLLTLRYSGPWPPYNFVNIRLKLEKSP